jgi:tRNA A37 methylthiotransferase MiaB
VPPHVVAERREQLRTLEKELADDYARRLLGRRLDVLVEGSDPNRPGFVQGTSCRAVTVHFRGHAPALLRKVVPVRAVEIVDDGLLGEPEPASLIPLPTRRVDRDGDRVQVELIRLALALVS